MDDINNKVPGSDDVRNVLQRDPLYRIFGILLASPWILGLVIGLIVVLMVVLGPSSDSRFIYTDF